jgi:hypothetical protein
MAPLLAAPIGGAAYDHGLAGLRMGCELDLDAFVDHVPAIRASKLTAELLQF